MPSLLETAKAAALAKAEPEPTPAQPSGPAPTLGAATSEANTFFDRTGQAVGAADPTQAFATGQLSADKTRRYNVVDGKGNAYSVAGDQLGGALGVGLRVESPEETALREQARVHAERGTVGQQALAGVEGFARGLTLGASDVVLNQALGKDYSQGAKERAEANPVTAGGGEVVGAIAPSLIPGGAEAEAASVAARGKGAFSIARDVAGFTPAGLASKAGSAAERIVSGVSHADSVLGRMAARAAEVGASGAVEGALYGAGAEASKAALDGTDITAEKVLSGMGHGALLGGLAGAGLGAVGSGLSSAADALTSKTVRQRAQQLANESALKAAGFGGSDFRRVVGRKVGEAADDRIAEVGSQLLNYEFKSGPLAGKKLFTGAKKAEDLIDDISFAKHEIGAELGAVRREVDAITQARPELGVDTAAYLKRVDSEVLEPLRASNSPTVRNQAKKIESELELLRARTEAGPVEVRLADGSTELRERTPLTFGELEQFRRDLRTVIQPPKPAGGGLPAAVPEHAQHLEKVERMLADELDTSVEKALTESGKDPAAFKQLKREYSAFSDLETVANKAAKQHLGNRAISPSDYAAGLSAAIGMLASGNVGGLAAGAATAFAHKLIRERGRSVLAQLADSVAHVDARTIESVKSLAGQVAKVPRRALIAGEAFDHHYEIASEAVRSFQADPKVAQRTLAAPVERLAQSHPELAGAIQEKLRGDFEYLATLLPQPMTRASSSLTPLATKQHVPHAAKVKFANAFDAIADPTSVLEDLVNGRVPREKIEALKARRPERFQEIRAQVIQYTANNHKELPYLKRVRLSLAFDFAGDKSLTPANIAAIQADNRTPVNEEQQQSAQQEPKPSQSLASLDSKMTESATLPGETAAV